VTECEHSRVNYSNPLQCDICKKVKIGGEWVNSPDREPPVQEPGGLIAALGKQVVIEGDPMAQYRKQRDAVAAKMGGLIPIAEGRVVGVDMAQEGTSDVTVRLVFTSGQFDQIALMAAPHHGMRIVVLEDRRR